MKLAAAAALLFLPVPALAASPPSVGSLGRDLVLSQSVPGRVVAVASNVSIESAVAGDVIVWGGDVSFGPNGSIAGNLVVFGGTIRDRIGPSGRPLPVAGTVSTPGTLLPLYLAEMRRAPWETSVLSPVVWGFKLLALAAWLAIAVALLYVFGSPLARAADRAESDWAGALTAGALGVLTIFLAAAATLTLLPSSIAVPIALLLGVAAVAAKVFGMGALFLLVGQKLLDSFSPARRPAALALGFAVLGGISLLPVAGAIVWSVASIVAVGVAFLSRFGSPRFRVALTNI
ncbi:MAG: hypothetical protein DMF55_06055 [Acidobacteria bacterium]|nr:MAG: hypothetical protein DMF55_06055 [Acidobacteriota bacterium]